jgi:ABC-type nitrate/sulfonate/bicarbonate transport system ATPase subunit
MTEPILETRQLYKFYGTDGGKLAVVRELSLSVAKGRFVTVMGPSGSIPAAEAICTALRLSADVSIIAKT